MEALIVEGGARLKGEVQISGAKNAVLPIMAATLLTDEECVIKNVPDLRDVRTMLRLLEELGVECTKDGSEVRIRAKSIKNPVAPYELVKTMRASVLVLGPLVARERFAKVSLPGGCAIGERPIDLHINGLRQLGVDVELEHGYVVAKAQKLKGNVYVFDKVTVTGTENIVMAAVLAEGETILENVAQEPEVWDTIEVLKKMGAKIDKVDGNTLRIKGVDKLRGFEHEVMPDRIEAATFLIAGAMAGEEVVVKGAQKEHLVAVLTKLNQCGVKIEDIEVGLKVYGCDVIRAVDMETFPYPGFPTDVQAQYMAMMCIANGTSVITENIFERRFMHVAELRRMGADITVEGKRAVVRGVDKLVGAPVMASDLRASSSLVLAALVAEGESKISRIYHLDRGYERFDKKLEKLGAKIRRIKE
ncbi:UDP-N-acetylglucosamine 1-carboxyvinyltransferase [Thermosulfidibacter takaii ABI70S6]|uniref:UDP-N-acetylglucosamine 1-carboxyvinyltransferase n=1 Tax=Thermosulfidibacter takaii (strain DSM 17441 / JCM 13301 / NBRC 103674 / ABI70S6) TaxID=1298851 RepID=A0A0S3QW40_THET7|nr:UDP-N-acetylglucosamine 1-carboxyvinyltransferase [Thermosulfidibacter takaii]BAT72536.1 UDP-N-acetylglucosamine 1-carboxyvinyltransferase [Thermosulfidibacter takaii ABI70S6]